VDSQPLTLAEETPEVKPDTTPDNHNICEVCGEPVYREPGKRGRIPKTHPSCKGNKTSGVTREKTPAARTKAEREADLVILGIRKQVMKGVMLLTAFDDYSAFVIMVNMPDVLDNFRGILISSDSLRRDFLKVKSGGSWLAFIISILMMFLPLGARWGLIPSSKYAEMIMQLPVFLHKIHAKMSDGESALTDLIERQMNERTKPQPDNRSTTQNGGIG
jgi:hypothetical protein